MPDSMQTTLAATTTLPAKKKLPPRDHRVRRFKREILKTAPELNDPRYSPVLHTFARANILLLDSYDFLRTNGLVNENGELRSSVDTVNRLINTVLKAGAALGLTPAGMTKLRKDRPIDLVAALASAEDADAETENR